MGFRIGTNVASLSAQRSLSQSQTNATRASNRLSSGSRFATTGEDTADFEISENLRGQAASLAQAKRNTDSAGGLIQVAEGGLNEQNNILVRLRELAVQSASDTVGEDERGFLDTEFKGLVSEFDRIAKTTTYGKKQLLSGKNTTYEFQVGSGNTSDDIIKYQLDADTTASGVGIKGLSVNEKGDALDSLDSIDKAETSVAKARAGFGAIQERLQIAGNNLDTQNANVLEARSRIADTDVAAETANLTQARVQQEFGTSVLAQANQDPARALKLLG